MSDQSAALAPCELHELEIREICYPPEPQHRRGRSLDVDPGSYVSIRGGRGSTTTRTASSSRVTGTEPTPQRWERVVHTAEQLTLSDLRPADCCQPPLFAR